MIWSHSFIHDLCRKRHGKHHYSFYHINKILVHLWLPLWKKTFPNANYSSYMDVFSEEPFFQLGSQESFVLPFLLPYLSTAPVLKWCGGGTTDLKQHKGALWGLWISSIALVTDPERQIVPYCKSSTAAVMVLCVAGSGMGLPWMSACIQKLFFFFFNVD